MDDSIGSLLVKELVGFCFVFGHYLWLLAQSLKHAYLLQPFTCSYSIHWEELEQVFSIIDEASIMITDFIYFDKATPSFFFIQTNSF